MAALLLAPLLAAQGLGSTTAGALSDTLDVNDSTTSDLEDTANETDDTLSTNDTTGNLTDEAGDLLEDGNSSEELPPCRPGPSPNKIVCDLPPTCSTVFEGTRECEPPAACQRHGPDRILCASERLDGAGPARSLNRNGTNAIADIEADHPDDVREQLRTYAAEQLSSYRAELDVLRERYQEGLEELRTTYREAIDRLRDAYEVCLEDQPADRCRERALSQRSVLRDRLHDQRDALRVSLIAEADQGAADVCASIDAQYRALAQTAGIHQSTRASIQAATLPALCR